MVKVSCKSSCNSERWKKCKMYLLMKLFQGARLVLKYITEPKGNGPTEEKNLSEKNRNNEAEFCLSEERQASEMVSLNIVCYPSICISFMDKHTSTASGVNIFSKKKIRPTFSRASNIAIQRCWNE